MKKVPLNAIPEPWEYNPSKWSQRILIALIAGIAFILATYMALYQWGLIDHVWDPVFKDGSEKVLTSDVSHEITSWIRIPDGALGSIAYLGDILFALAGSTRRWMDRPWLVIIFGIDVIPLGIVSAILVGMQGFVVKFWCFPCLITAVISLVLIFMAYDEVLSSIFYLHRIWKKSHDKKIFWDAFWGKPSEIANEVGYELAKRRTRYM